MNEEMKQIIKEEAIKYATHYFEIFFSKAESNHPVPFEDHYRELKFVKEFFYGIIYEEQPFLNYLEEKRTEFFRKYKSDIEMLEANDVLEKEVIKEVSNVYQSYFAMMYLELLNEKMADYLEELEYATEDAEYYRERKYIGEEDTIGGTVSEEERIRLMEEYEENQDKYSYLIEKLKAAKAEIEPYAVVPA